MEVSHFERAEIVALIEKTSCGSFDSQIEYYRQRLGGIADAEVTLQMMEFSRYDVSWWRVASCSGRKRSGNHFPGSGIRRTDYWFSRGPARISGVEHRFVPVAGGLVNFEIPRALHAVGGSR